MTSWPPDRPRPAIVRLPNSPFPAPAVLRCRHGASGQGGDKKQSTLGNIIDCGAVDMFAARSLTPFLLPHAGVPRSPTC